MKKLLLALLLATATISCSKSSDETHISLSMVPSIVMTAFNSMYKSASGPIKWELEHGNVYKVQFYIGSQRWESRFDSNGGFISAQRK